MEFTTLELRSPTLFSPRFTGKDGDRQPAGIPVPEERLRAALEDIAHGADGITDPWLRSKILVIRAKKALRELEGEK